MTSTWKRKFKRQMSKWKEGPYAFIAIIIVVMSIILLVAYVAPYLQQITYDYTNRYYDYDEDTDDRTYYYDLVEYTDRIYVHKDGDNSDGETWETAYSTLNRAYNATSADLDDKTIIFVGIGLFDVNCVYQLNITKNIHIVGSGRDATIFTNTHASAEYVLNATRYFKMENCEILMDDEYGGIQIYGNNSDTRLIHMRFLASVVDVPVALHLHDGGHGEFEDIYIGGNGTLIIGIFLNGSRHNHFNNIEIFRCKSAVRFDWINTDGNFFSDIRIVGAPKGLDIFAGNDQHFEHMFFEQCNMAVDDEVGDSSWFEIYTDTMLCAVQPQDLVGVDVDTAIAADTYGADVLILDASDEDIPYYIVAILFEPDTKEKYGLRLWVGTGYFYETVIEAKFLDERDRHTIEMPRIFNAHSQIYCSVKSETGNNDMDVWLEIVAI